MSQEEGKRVHEGRKVGKKPGSYDSHTHARTWAFLDFQKT